MGTNLCNWVVYVALGWFWNEHLSSSNRPGKHAFGPGTMERLVTWQNHGDGGDHKSGRDSWVHVDGHEVRRQMAGEHHGEHHDEHHDGHHGQDGHYEHDEHGEHGHQG